ncbi:GGDEF domain-containing protein [Photobacterium sp. BZF1]|uniref:GGDEF domain-containing protein n=1 Tax=Photobacterium sp. BZF1 TaxID=1904457 RepID=UPI001653E462|nr:GGDEF domain-containing protein [Photobacterium sp. BZF1]MBC7006428.1 GGDEF domain-containing protein [Photobacterium sp. BZF1]
MRKTYTLVTAFSLAVITFCVVVISVKTHLETQLTSAHSRLSNFFNVVEAMLKTEQYHYDYDSNFLQSHCYMFDAQNLDLIVTPPQQVTTTKLSSTCEKLHHISVIRNSSDFLQSDEYVMVEVEGVVITTKSLSLALLNNPSYKSHKKRITNTLTIIAFLRYNIISDYLQNYPFSNLLFDLDPFFEHYSPHVTGELHETISPLQLSSMNAGLLLLLFFLIYGLVFNCIFARYYRLLLLLKFRGKILKNIKIAVERPSSAGVSFFNSEFILVDNLEEASFIKRTETPSYGMNLILSKLKINHDKFLVISTYFSREHSLYQGYQRKAFFDPLTQLYNREYLQYFTSNCMGLYFVALLDLDDFKSINDDYGHEFGDNTLQYAARFLTKSFPTKDSCLVRYGGEEFLTIVKIKEVIHHKVLLNKLNSFNNSKITWSGGACIWQSEQESFDAIFSACDNQLYYIKAHGKARVDLICDEKELLLAPENKKES